MEIVNDEFTQKAIKFYSDNLARRREYHQKNLIIDNARCRLQFQKLKNNPEKYAIYLEKRRLMYKNKKDEQNKLNVIIY
jgi:hypothetical protein